MEASFDDLFAGKENEKNVFPDTEGEAQLLLGPDDLDAKNLHSDDGLDEQGRVDFEKAFGPAKGPNGLNDPLLSGVYEDYDANPFYDVFEDTLSKPFKEPENETKVDTPTPKKRGRGKKNQDTDPQALSRTSSSPASVKRKVARISSSDRKRSSSDVQPDRPRDDFKYTIIPIPYHPSDHMLAFDNSTAKTGNKVIWPFMDVNGSTSNKNVLPRLLADFWLKLLEPLTCLMHKRLRYLSNYKDFLRECVEYSLGSNEITELKLYMRNTMDVITEQEWDIITRAGYDFEAILSASPAFKEKFQQLYGGFGKPLLDIEKRESEIDPVDWQKAHLLTARWLSEFHYRARLEEGCKGLTVEEERELWKGYLDENLRYGVADAVANLACYHPIFVVVKERPYSYVCTLLASIFHFQTLFYVPRESIKHPDKLDASYPGNPRFVLIEADPIKRLSPAQMWHHYTLQKIEKEDKMDPALFENLEVTNYIPENALRGFVHIKLKNFQYPNCRYLHLLDHEDAIKKLLPSCMRAHAL